MKKRTLSTLLLLLVGLLLPVVGAAEPAAQVTELDSLAAFAKAAAGSDQHLRLKPGVYQMKDYLTEEVLAAINAWVDRRQSRPPVPMLLLTGNRNRIELEDVVIEIDTALYAKLPKGGYTRCVILAGEGNTLSGLTIRNTGSPDKGSGGNILSVAGANNTLENVTLHVSGSWPYGYGDLLGKGGPNLVAIQKQSGIQILGNGSVLRRCKVYSRALGHCFYIQVGGDIRLEDCQAEGEMRATNEMLLDRSGAAFELGFKSVFENRDGRYRISPGYVKSLCEDGFRTYGGAGRVTLVNCRATNTRAGFEIGARDDAKEPTIVENCEARGCERGYLIGSHTIVRHSRGDLVYGPLLYLRGGLGSQVELELVGEAPKSTVHALATIAGRDHKVRLFTQQLATGRIPALPIMFGYGMPDHAEMSSPIRTAPTQNVSLDNAIAAAPLLSSGEEKDCTVRTAGRSINDSDTKASPGAWGGRAPAGAGQGAKGAGR